MTKEDKDLTREQVEWIAEEICDNRGVLNVSPTFIGHLLENMPKKVKNNEKV